MIWKNVEGVIKKLYISCTTQKDGSVLKVCFAFNKSHAECEVSFAFSELFVKFNFSRLEIFKKFRLLPRLKLYNLAARNTKFCLHTYKLKIYFVLLPHNTCCYWNNPHFCVRSTCITLCMSLSFQKFLEY